VWTAETTSDRDRKELLRTLLREAVVSVRTAEACAAVELFWEGGACSELRVPLVHRGPERHRTSEDTVDLVRRLAAHYPDRQIAAILNKQGAAPAPACPSAELRVRGVRPRTGIPAAPPVDPASDIVTIEEAATELGVSAATVRRWLNEGLLPGEQMTPHAPWRIRLSEQVRRRFVPELPEGYLPLNEAATMLAIARQTVLHQVQRGERRAVQVTRGRRKGLRIEVLPREAGPFATD
jgi:excisionase family DNA binding protein